MNAKRFIIEVMTVKRFLACMLALLTLTATASAEGSQPLTLFAVNVGKGDALLLPWRSKRAVAG